MGGRRLVCPCLREVGIKTMTTYIALFRGINVGGKNTLPMKELSALVESHGYTEPQTCIQSGNLVIRSSEKAAKQFEKKIGAAIEQRYGFAPRIPVLSLDDLKKAMRANPYPEADNDPKSVHLYFLAARLKEPDLRSLAAIQKPNESFALKGSVFYLHAPDGIGRSKVAERVEKALGVAVTARNWRTVGKLVEMAEMAEMAEE